MKLPTPRSLARGMHKLVARTPDSAVECGTHSLRTDNAPELLGLVSGIVHVGANLGQERDVYAHADLPVIWIEPIPEIFARLKANLAGYPKQVAYECLITDQDDRDYTFHIANNDGASSSIFDFKLHKGVWPEVCYTKDITLRSCT